MSDMDSDSGHAPAPGAPMDAATWDERYAGGELVWGRGANRWVVQYTGDLAPGRALDIACGEGRNAIWLAARGWAVTGVDFSPVAIDKARRLEQQAAHPDAAPVRWICADATAPVDGGPVDLAMLVYLHLPAAQRRSALAAAVAALGAGGTLLVVGHGTRNIAEGVGGPQSPEILYTPEDIAADLAGIDPGLQIVTAVDGLREVAGADRPAIDTLVLARRPDHGQA